jgi:hypothetical protein
MPRTATFKPNELKLSEINNSRGHEQSIINDQKSYKSSNHSELKARNDQLQERLQAMEKLIKDRIHNSQVTDYSQVNVTATVPCHIASESDSQSQSQMNFTHSRITSYVQTEDGL